MDTLNKILILIAQKKIEQQDFADELGINKQTITDWKSGKSKSYFKYVDRIAAYFNVSTDYLLGNADDPTPANKKDPSAEVEKSDDMLKLEKLLNELSIEDLRAVAGHAEYLASRHKKPNP